MKSGWLRFAPASALGLVLTLGGQGPAWAQNFADVKPSPQQVQWQDLEFGVLIHFGTNTFLDREWGDGTADPKVFNPSALDAEQWMRAIRAAGARYVVLVAKHHDGFCLWPTAQTSYSVKSSPWKNGQGDVVGLAAAAARKAELGFGVYMSPWDRHEPRYANAKDYDSFYIDSLNELVGHYGQLVEFWLDGAGSGGHVYDFDAIVETLRTYQPNTLVFADAGLLKYADIRWVGNEEGYISYENWNVIDRHGYLRWRPVESDTPLHEGQWFWHPNSNQTLKSLAKLIETYEQTVGRGGQLMLGLAPDRRGLIPEADVKRLEELGTALRQRYQNNLVAQHHLPAADNEAAALDGDPGTFWSAPAGSHHAVLEVSFPAPLTFDHLLLMERLNNGQHVQEFRLESWDGTRWRTVIAGNAIGHKRIEGFAPVSAARVRLNIVQSTDAAEIREFQLFRLDGHP